MSETIRIGVVAPGRGIDAALAADIKALVAGAYGPRVEIYFHPQCFLKAGHFAGPDEARAAAFVEIANDPRFDALWFARGGYGSCRIAHQVLHKLNDSARRKTYLGYSDAGTLLAGLYKQGFPNLAHGPMPIDIVRDGGIVAVKRGLGFLVDQHRHDIEPSVVGAAPNVAFNLTILANLIGTPLQPDLSGHVLMIEEVGEYMYRIDRALCHVSSNEGIRRIAGLKLGRCSDVPVNDPDFGMNEEDVAKHWCAVSGIAYLGRADIGHDVANKIVPFGRG
ncbi:MAG: LD-carboxypeptidase [Terricaulis sp.]